MGIEYLVDISIDDAHLCPQRPTVIPILSRIQLTRCRNVASTRLFPRSKRIPQYAHGRAKKTWSAAFSARPVHTCHQSRLAYSVVVTTQRASPVSPRLLAPPTAHQISRPPLPPTRSNATRRRQEQDPSHAAGKVACSLLLVIPVGLVVSDPLSLPCALL